MLYIVSGLFVVLLVLCFTSLVNFTGFCTEDEPYNSTLLPKLVTLYTVFFLFSTLSF